MPPTLQRDMKGGYDLDITQNAATSRQISMDIPRASRAGKRALRYVIYTVLALGAATFVTVNLARMKPAAPRVDRSTVWVDTVKRGEMMREVRGLGALVPKDARIVAATTNGVVERVLVQPGEVVAAGTLLVELKNPELEQSRIDAEYQLRAAEADLKSLGTRLESERMSQQAAAAAVSAEYEQAKIQADTDAELAKDGLVPALTLRLSRVKVAELASRQKIEQQRLEVSVRSAQAQQASQQARISQLQALVELRSSQLASLGVRAGIAGVLQELQVVVGQRVEPGTNLAKVVAPEQLKAQLRIPETQAKDIQLGQLASIDTHNGVVAGRVERIDPAVQQGTVTVDVALTGALPQGARPDLSIEGNIELERLSDVLFTGRPAFGQADGAITLFKLEENGKRAVRVQIKLGRNSVNKVEVLEGLSEGDQIILSDTSAWDGLDLIELN